MAQHRMAQIGAFLLENVQYAVTQPFPAGQVDLDRHAGRGAGPARSAQGFLLIRGKAA